jgi:GntR family transcriptional regulator
MDIVLNRKGGVPVRDQIRAQVELKILGGELASGARLPSVRALARRLKVHPNTVSAAYQDLEGAGHLELRPGSGVFVRGVGPHDPREARDLDEMIRLALWLAFDRGYSGAEVRAAVERWLAAKPPDRVLVVDPSREMAELMAHELRHGLGLTTSHCGLTEIARNPGVVAGALAVALPYHVEALRKLVPGAPVQSLNLEVAGPDRSIISALPSGAVLLVVSHSPTVLPFAEVLVRSLRGDDVHLEARLLSEPDQWGRLARVADLVFADALAVAAVRRGRPRKLRELRFIPAAVLERLRDALTVVTPRS